eukprot:7565233-Pyramimonas_sp.AAC.1
MLGSSEFWRHCSHRQHPDAQFIGERAVCMARHCAESARSSVGRVYVGDLIRTLENDVIIYSTTALAVHGLMMLPSGAIDTLGIKADDLMLLELTKLMECW